MLGIVISEAEPANLPASLTTILNYFFSCG